MFDFSSLTFLTKTHPKEAKNQYNTIYKTPRKYKKLAVPGTSDTASLLYRAKTGNFTSRFRRIRCVPCWDLR